MAVNPWRDLVPRAKTEGKERPRQTHRQVGYHGYQSGEKRMEGDEPV